MSIDRFANAIIHGDSRTVMKSLPDASIDGIITSPPYNFKKPYATHDDGLDLDSYINKLLLPTWMECARVLKPGGRIAVNIQPLWSEHVKTHEIIGKQFEDLGLLFYEQIVWDKNTFSDGAVTAWGSWASSQYPRLRYRHEFIIVHAKETRQKLIDPETIAFFGSEKRAKKELEDITEDEFKQWTIGNWNFQPETEMKEMGHPAMFPEELPRRIMKLFFRVGDIILDPFCGLGTVPLVAWLLDRRFIGIEISGEYCKKAMNRVRGVSSQTRLVDRRDRYPFTYPKPKLLRGNAK